ncbi:hypothetical protein BBK82_18680 [Lentzea guizhouensis]|uniref:Uncharacterized protein n=1 Tax=Lentzea guizhouensis TaxID=1586287 RepID=A0A1B2HJ84_9PSEU|nr:hypothetical protein BBK82_18680 [Lentzea guizhouensis]
MVVVALTAAVLVLRSPAPEPEPERVERVTGSSSGWRQVTVSGGDARRTFVDGDLVFVGDGLLGSRRVERNQTTLSTVERDVELSASGHVASGPIAVTPAVFVLQDGTRCLEVVDPDELTERGRHCAGENAEISLLSAEDDGVQWRETVPGEKCAVWFRLSEGVVPQRLPVSESACRSAVLVRADGWELTADFPPYQTGAAHPGSLVARKDGREILLDHSAADVRECGEDVYWLSGTGLGTLVRWRPGTIRAEVTELVEPKWLRCVNGAVNAVGPTALWLPEER